MRVERVVASTINVLGEVAHATMGPMFERGETQRKNIQGTRRTKGSSLQLSGPNELESIVIGC
jgi:hypothetical protein